MVMFNRLLSKQAKALERYGRPALSKAFFAEMIPMMAYEEEAEEAGKSGVRVK